jgi:VIT1/CCC1 family predicted Fe2+/Mn2+ transporter
MHRVVEQERWEIQHHRQQEREELGELYRAKGFEGKLLEDVLDVLMADEERLLKVMVEEELCLSLSTQEHPLKQGLGAAIGTFAASCVCLLVFYLSPTWGMWIGSFLTLGVAAAVSTWFERNRLIPGIVWNLGLGAITSGCVYFLLDYTKL